MLWFPNRTATVKGLHQALDHLEDEGWVSKGEDLVVIADYFDIFAPEAGTSTKDFRHVENDRWEAGRRLSQDWNCALVTASQANADRGGNRRILRQKDQSEDTRKSAHVTAMYGLNKDNHDKLRGWLRINPIVVREEEYSEWDQVTVLQMIQRGCPNLGSFWYKKAKEEA